MRLETYRTNTENSLILGGLEKGDVSDMKEEEEQQNIVCSLSFRHNTVTRCEISLTQTLS